jgi:plasmid segregation protein ParM
MENIIAGIDSGYGFAIGESNKSNKTILMRNYVRRISKKESVDISQNIKEINENNILIKYDDKYYICGELCLTYYPTEQMKLDDNRVNNIYHLIEILMVAGQLSKDNEFNLFLTVGLPNRLKEERQNLINWLQNKFEFSFLTINGEIKKSVNIVEVSCIPQVYAPIFTLPEDKRNKYICSIDLGHKTADIMLINNFNIVKQPGASISAEGCIHLYKLLETQLVNKFSQTNYKKKDYSQILLQKIFEKEEYKIGDTTQDISDILDFVINDYLDYVYYKVENSAGEYLVDADIFIASGGILKNNTFRKTLADKFKAEHGKPFMTAKDPQLAIANGLFQYALLQYQDKIIDTKEKDTDDIEEMDEINEIQG